MSKTTSLAPETLAAQALHDVDLQTGAIIPPIQPSTTFVRDENYELLAPAHSYGCDENPGYLTAEKLLAELKGAPAALLFGSGMAAAMAVVQSLKPGDHIVSDFACTDWRVTARELIEFRQATIDATRIFIRLDVCAT